MPRSMYSDVITQRDNADGKLIALADIQVAVKVWDPNSSSYSPASIYLSKTGGQKGSGGQFNTTDGRVEFYADPGTYQISFTDTTGQNRISTRVIEWESVPNDDPRLSWLPGMAAMWFSGTAPTGFIFAQGQVITSTDYPAIWSLIGTAYNIGGEAAGGRRMPDFRSRVPIGAGTGTGLTNRVLGTYGGAETVAIAQGNLPNYNLSVSGGGHTHGVPLPYTSMNVAVGSGPGYISINALHTPGVPADTGTANFATDSQTPTHTVNSGGSGTALANIQPYVAVNVIVKT